MPPILLWALGALGAAAVARVLVQEWRRVNAELDRVSPEERERQSPRTLRRDPSTGVYRPD
jgi:hypothetical protein